MSEENESGLSTLKKTVIGIATTAITAAGAYVTTHIEAIFGGGEEEVKTEQVAQPTATPAPIILNIDNSSTNNANASSGGGTTIIKETVREVPAAQPAPVQVVEEKPETPAERMARLKKQREEQNAGK
jgi:hypothetical protein